MSKSYPSRRELRLQREREERAKLRDEEAQRWATELEQRVASSAQDEPTEQVEDQEADIDDTASLGRRASGRPVDAPADVDEAAVDAPAGTRRRRRVDSEVTSTGMIPIISKPRADKAAERPVSRREKREIEARRAAERRAEIARLEREQEKSDPKPARRATAPQTTPISVPPITVPAVPQHTTAEPDSAPDEDVDVTMGDSFTESAVEITDMSGLDTIEIRRAALRAETERLTQEILEMGQANPNVIDPAMLRRQKELAEKSKELQDLETAAIAIIEESEQPTADDDEASSDDGTQDPGQAELVITTTDAQPIEPEPEPEDLRDEGTEADEVVEETITQTQQPAVEIQDEPSSPDTPKATRRRTRRAQSPPMITGPFDVDQHAADKPAPVPSAELLGGQQRPAKQSSGEPVDATEAHGLDSLDDKVFEAPERRMVLSSAIVFAIGIIALITAIILLIR